MIAAAVMLAAMLIWLEHLDTENDLEFTSSAPPLMFIEELRKQF